MRYGILIPLTEQTDVMNHGESITEYLKRRLREAGAARFAAIAEATGVTDSFIRKFVYGSRDNPRVQTIQPLLDYFAAVDRGERKLPEVVPSPRPAATPAPSAA